MKTVILALALLFSFNSQANTLVQNFEICGELEYKHFNAHCVMAPCGSFTMIEDNGDRTSVSLSYQPENRGTRHMLINLSGQIQKEGRNFQDICLRGEYSANPRRISPNMIYFKGKPLNDAQAPKDKGRG